MERAFTQRQKLERLMEAGWFCEATGIPLIFPPALCLLDRLVSCPGGVGTRHHGYYDYREKVSEAPLQYLTCPMGDHVDAFAGGGQTTSKNLQILASPINLTKSKNELSVIPSQESTKRAKLEKEASAKGATIVYWPPSQAFGEAHNQNPEQHLGLSNNTATNSSNYDGMLGVFLRLYHPELPEVTSTWKPREDKGRNDTSFMRGWYQTVWEMAQDKHDPFRRYQQLGLCSGLWPNPLT